MWQTGLQCIPNAFSYTRVLAVFLAWYLLQTGAEWLLVPLVAMAGLTDFLDGWTARKLNTRSAWGVVLDPLADKLFCNGVLWFAFVSHSGYLLGGLVLVNTLYDIDQTWRRREEIRQAWRGVYAKTASLPASLLAKCKTAVLFGLLGLLFTPPFLAHWYEPVVTPLFLVGYWWVLKVATGVALLLVICSWWYNRQTWIWRQLGWRSV